MVNTLRERVPVRYKDRTLMPMKWSKAHRLIKEDKATLVETKLGIAYLKLKYEPSGYKTQEVILGIDPGSVFDAYSVVTKNFNIHYQTSFQTNRSEVNKIKNRSAKRRANRRIRRSKKSRRHQKIRNGSRTSKKYSNTIISKLMRMKWVIHSLLRYFPISKVVVEEVSSMITCKAFTNVELGKSELRRFIEEDLKLEYLNSKSKELTYDLRMKYFKGDPKLSNKFERSFYTHSVDSYVIALDSLNRSENDKYRIKSRHLNSHTIFINQVDWVNRRELDKRRSLYGCSKNYFRYGKSGKVIYFNHYPKLRKVRSKPDNITKSNHIPNWIYAYQNVLLPRDQYLIDQGKEVYSYAEPTYKCFKSRHGGSIVTGQSSVNLPRGISKYSVYDWSLNKVIRYKHLVLD